MLVGLKPRVKLQDYKMWYKTRIYLKGNQRIQVT